MVSIQPPALRLMGVEKRFGKSNGRVALSGVDLSIEDGEVLTVLGPSGAGKSTLLQVAGLFLTPDLGEVFLRGQSVSQLPSGSRSRYRRQELALVFQRPALIPEFTILENLLLKSQISNGTVETPHLPLVKKFMLDAGLSGCEALFPVALSETQRKLVSLIGALVNMPSILLVDEPVAGMDDETAEMVCRWILEANSNFRTTCVMVSNDRRLLDRSNRVIELREGRVAADFKKQLD